MGFRRLLPRPKEPPEGFMYWHGRLTKIEDVEALAETIMEGFDRLPPMIRYALNCAPVWPHKAGVEFARRGEAAAAQSIIKMHWDHVFKTRDRKGVHP